MSFLSDVDAPQQKGSGEQSHRTKGLLRLTMACNERCPFCNVPAEDYSPLTPPQDEIDRQLDVFIKDGAQTLTISGGEPTLLKKRLLPLISRARANGIPFVDLQTNAVLIDQDYGRALAEAGLTSAFVSFLSHVPEHHDALTALEGSYARCLRGIDALLDHGVQVTLNPVMAWPTQHLIPDYIDFVAQRLSRVRFISLSAVQPHGRGRDNIQLMPDYAILDKSVREARVRADRHGIEMVNPYCGLPLCIGWDDGQEQSVEAFEAERGGWRSTRGLANLGNKSHGKPCETCALRTRCGGAWHAYWADRDGSGISPPLRVRAPWISDEQEDGQAVVLASGGPSDETFRAIEGIKRAPTRWVWTDRLGLGDGQRLLASRCTDLALDLSAENLLNSRATLKEIRRIIRISTSLQPQKKLRVAVGFRPGSDGNRRVIYRGIALAAALEVDVVHLLSDDNRWQRLAAAVGQEFPRLGIQVVKATRTLDG